MPRHALTCLALAAALAALVGCGRSAPPLARPLGAAAPAARGVTPGSTFDQDVRRAKYWQADAALVMQIHTTVLGTGLAASANVFFSREAIVGNQMPVFVARHYGARALAQYQALPDHERYAGTLKPLGAFQVDAKEAYDLARKVMVQPDPNVPPAPTGDMRYFPSSRALLFQPGEGNPEWRVYATSKRWVIDAQTRQVSLPTVRETPSDRLNGSRDADLQRAAQLWLPMALGADRPAEQPEPSN